MKKAILFASAALLAAAPVVAQSVPVVAPVEGEQLSEGGAGIVAAALIAGIVAIAVVAASSGDDQPVSA